MKIGEVEIKAGNRKGRRRKRRRRKKEEEVKILPTVVGGNVGACHLSTMLKMTTAPYC